MGFQCDWDTTTSELVGVAPAPCSMLLAGPDWSSLRGGQGEGPCGESDWVRVLLHGDRGGKHVEPADTTPGERRREGGVSSDLSCTDNVIQDI